MDCHEEVLRVTSRAVMELPMTPTEIVASTEGSEVEAERVPAAVEVEAEAGMETRTPVMMVVVVEGSVVEVIILEPISRAKVDSTS